MNASRFPFGHSEPQMNATDESCCLSMEGLMSELNTLDYYRRRERQERVLAEGAQIRGIQKIHLDMAEHYASLVARAEGDAPRESLKLVANGR
jgi:hypothetical protein